jgi:hypothetical protein
MTKLEFLKELESLLPDIPLEEREEALQYYNGYFEDAGEDNEEVIMKELGSPSKVAAIIKADLNSNATDRESRGYFTEKGYQDTIYKEEKYEIIGTANKGTTNQEETYHTNKADSAKNPNESFSSNGSYNTNGGYNTNGSQNANRANDTNNAGYTNGTQYSYKNTQQSKNN